MELELIPRGFPRREEILTAVRLAAEQLEPSRPLASLTLVLDAPEFEGCGYWQLDPDPAGEPKATLYGSPNDVLSPPGRDEEAGVALDESRLDEISPDRVDRLRTDRWIFRNLLQLDDLLSERIQPAAVAKGSSRAFQTCWDVWTDGRLKGRAMPGISQAERRGVFFRTFAAGGLLLPRHWEVFHALWEGRLAEQDGLTRAVGELPRPAV